MSRSGVADIALATLVLSAVGLMIVPLPTPVLDILIAANLSLAVSILLVVLYVSDAVAVATFPTLLLLTTLFRLSLNVASTRLILLQANAGEVIRAFGSFVVRGNYVVGFVVFLVLTLIQFIVIAKGSERVAEVGARFALDSLPGKQMAIDAELRGGAIDGFEAKRRRRALSRESQFYGAMDGAMKFVKGDVIASIAITGINLVGGLAIGVGQKGMPAVAALKRYGLLTIGDGLVTQIPALILSTAAGVLVTRVASEEVGTPLGEELATQLLSVPKALRAASVFVLALAAVPGLPAAPFLAIGTALFIVASLRTKQLAREDDRTRMAMTRTGTTRRSGHGADFLPFIPVVVPWSVQVGRGLGGLLGDSGGRSRDADGASLHGQLLSLRETMFQSQGMPLPSPHLRVSGDMAPRGVEISLFEVPARTFVLGDDLDDPSAVASIVREAQRVLGQRASEFLGLSEVQTLVDELEQISPAIVRNLIPKPVTIVVLTEVLRRLASEQIPIRDLRAVLEALSSVAVAERAPVVLSEHVRSELRRIITHKVVSSDGRLRVITLDPHVEDVLRNALSTSPAGVVLALAPQAAREMIAAFAKALGPGRLADSHAVVLTHPDVRRFVRKLLENDAPNIMVVSPQELLPATVLQPVARVSLDA